MSKVINGVNVTELMQTIDAVKADTTVAKFRFRSHNEWLEGGHNRSTLNEIYGAGQMHHRAKSFVIHADEPIVLLGSDQAPNPAEYLLTALAACVTSSPCITQLREASRSRRSSRRSRETLMCAAFSGWTQACETASITSA